ncbi:unnamed protein product [Prunus brigantina]
MFHTLFSLTDSFDMYRTISDILLLSGEKKKKEKRKKEQHFANVLPNNNITGFLSM